MLEEFAIWAKKWSLPWSPVVDGEEDGAGAGGALVDGADQRLVGVKLLAFHRDSPDAQKPL